MKVLGVKRTTGSLSRDQNDFLDEVHTLDGLGHVLARSDFIVNVLPLTHKTKNLFTIERFE